MDNKFMDDQWDNYSDLPSPLAYTKVRREIQSVQFKDDYMVIETLGRTHSIKKTEVGEGEWDSLQAHLLQIVERRDKKNKYYSDYWDRGLR